MGAPELFYGKICAAPELFYGKICAAPELCYSKICAALELCYDKICASLTVSGAPMSIHLGLAAARGLGRGGAQQQRGRHQRHTERGHGGQLELTRAN